MGKQKNETSVLLRLSIGPTVGWIYLAHRLAAPSPLKSAQLINNIKHVINDILSFTSDSLCFSSVRSGVTFSLLGVVLRIILLCRFLTYAKLGHVPGRRGVGLSREVLHVDSTLLQDIRSSISLPYHACLRIHDQGLLGAWPERLNDVLRRLL